MTGISALFALATVMPYLVAILLGITVPAIALLCYSRFSAGLFVIIAMFAAEALWMEVGGLQLGIRIYYTDFVLVLIAIVALLRFVLVRGTSRWHWAWGLYTLAFILSLGTGLLGYGSNAGVQARTYFYCFATGSYAMSFKIERRDIELVLDILSAIVFFLVTMCIYRWTVYYLPITELLPEGGVYNVDGAVRVVFSREALILGQVFVASIYFAKLGRGLTFVRFVSPLVFTTVIVLQHRSVWLAVLVGLMGGLLVGRSRSGSKLSQALLLAGIITVTTLPLALSETLSGVTSQVTGSASRAVDGAGSVVGRFQNWQGLIELWGAGGPRSWVFGNSFGTDATRYGRDSTGVNQKITFAAHNHYIQTLYNLGLLGLFGFLASMTYAIKGLYRLCSEGKGDNTAEALLTILLMQAAFYVPYSSDYLQSVLLGVAMAYVAGRERESKSASFPESNKTRPSIVRRPSPSKP
jgi:hypothetical protein